MSNLISQPNAWRRRLAAAVPRWLDRGSSSLLVSVLLGGGVLMGTAAVVVDVGQIYAEREELQSGADAAALAVAEHCVDNPASCGSQVATASQFADGNARDGHTRVTAICGNAPGLPACPPPTANLTACTGDPPASHKYVEVRTETEMADGSTLLPPSFAKALAGKETYQGTAIAACARVAWGNPMSATGTAVTISTCAWNELTHNGTILADPPPAAVPAGAEGVIHLHGPGVNTCAAGQSGWNAPGGFGWLDELAGPCKAKVNADGTFDGNTGASASGNCKLSLESARANQTLLWMPVFDGIGGTGASTHYHLNGFSAFILTGYKLPSMSAASTLTGNHYCNGSEHCLYGYFTTGLLPNAGLTDLGGDYGVVTIALTG